MVKLNFKNPTLEKIFRNYKWARNNSVQLLEAASRAEVLDFMPDSNEFSFQTIEHQFKCLVTTTDAYIRKLSSHTNDQFGILVLENGDIVEKSDLVIEQIKEKLPSQINELEFILKDYNEIQFNDNLKSIQSIINHEYLHQGQLIIMIRESGTDLPERFKSAFAL